MEMTLDAWVNLIQNVGVPIAILAFIGVYFVRPLGGTDGVVASFFRTQAENAAQQTRLMNEQKELVQRLAETIGTVSSSQQSHMTESSEYFASSSATEFDLLRIHRLIAKACQLEFQNQQAVELLKEVDEIVEKAIRKLHA